MLWTHCCSRTISISPAWDLLPTLGVFSALPVGWLTFLTPCKTSYATREERRNAAELNIQRGGYLSMSAIPACHQKWSGFPSISVQAGPSSWTICCAWGWNRAWETCELHIVHAQLGTYKGKGPKARLHICSLLCWIMSWPFLHPFRPGWEPLAPFWAVRFWFIVVVCTVHSSAEVLIESCYWVNNK